LVKELDEVLELGFGDGSNRYDGDKPAARPHRACTLCRKRINPDLSSFNRMTEELEQEAGFRIIIGLYPAIHWLKKRRSSDSEPLLLLSSNE